MDSVDQLFSDVDKPPENTSLGTTGDFAKTIGAGTARVGANLAAGGRYLAEGAGEDNWAEFAKNVQSIFAAGGDAIEGTINPKTRDLASSTLTSAEFWEHPILATSLKAAGTLPTMAAVAIPGGLMANAMRATVVAAGAGGAINAADGVDEFYRKLDAMSDEELQAQSPKYKAMRQLMDEGDARKRFNLEAQGWGPTINLLLGAASGAVGPAGVAARGLAGGAKNTVVGAAGRGRLASTGIAAGEGVATEAVEEGVQDITQQNAEIEASMQKEFDTARAANAALEGGVLGGLFGGAVGAVTGGHHAPTPKAKPVESDVQATSDVAAPQEKEGSTGTPAKPAEIEANPQNAPTTTPRDKGKASKRVNISKDTPPATEATLPPDIAAAAAANVGGPPPTPAATEVAAMAQRSPNETLDKLDEEGAAPVTPPATPAAAPVTPQAIPPEVTPQLDTPQLDTPQLDTGLNIPEKPQSIAEQIAQIGTGNRKAVMVPKGTGVPASTLGGRTDLKIMRTPRGRFIFDPKLVDRSTITKLSAAGRENELLGLGPVSKPAAIADAAAGATPVAVTERTPAGTEVKAAAGTTATLPEQRASLEAQATPGNVVAVETPEQVVAARMKPGGGRILRDLRQTEEERAAVAPPPPEAAPIKDPEAKGPGKNYRGKAGKERDAILAHSKDVVAAYPPDNAAEEGYHRAPAKRDVVVARARAMVADAEKRIGKPIQTQIKRSAKGDALSDDANVLLLRLAKDVVKVADKQPQGKAVTDAVTQFKTDETLILAGEKDEVIARRLEEGDRASRRTGGTKNDIEQHADTSEASEATEVEKAPKAKEIDEEGEAPAYAADATTGDEIITKAGDGESIDEHVTETVGDQTPTRDRSGEEDVEEDGETNSDHEYDAKSEWLPQEGPSVAHIPSKLEKPKSTLSPREARKAALAKLRPATIKFGKISAERGAKAKADVGRIMAEPLILQRERSSEPSEAQKRAGNYKKGHVKIEGMDFSIENPKGSIRRGLSPDGSEWSVKMPAAYGYIRRTIGADGEHIDAYDGGTGKRFFIIDQLDERTGEFDEHKVMLRFKDEQAAIDTHKRAFSDGKGDARLGYIHEVTPEELKAWINSGDTIEPHISHLVRDMDRVNFDAPVPRGRPSVTAGNGVKIHPVRSSNAATELDSLDLSGVTGVSGAMAKFFQARLRRLAGEVPVHYVTKEDYLRLAPEAPDGIGLHVRNAQTGNSEIYIRDNLADGTEYAGRAHVLIHELVHKVTVREIEKTPGAQAMIHRLAEIAFRNYKLNAAMLDFEYGPGVLDYGFTNAKEFIAEAFSNPKFQEFLARVPIDDAELARYLGVDRPGRMSAWDMLRKFVQKAVEKITGELPDASVLDGILKVGEHLTAMHEVGYPSPYAKGKVGDTRRGSAAQNIVQQEALQMTTRAAEGVRRILDRPHIDAPKALKLRTFDNIAAVADHYFGEGNPVRKIHSAIERMRVRSEQIAQQSEPVVRKLTKLRAKNRAAYNEMSSLMHDATVANVHPDVPLTDAKNKHLGKNALRGVWAKAQHAELLRRFRALPEEYKQAFHETTKHFRDQQNKMSLGILQNQVLKLLGYDDPALAKRVHEETLTDADKKLLGSNLEVLEKAGELSKIEGPYVPLMRRGNHVVKGYYRVTSPSNAKVISNAGGNVEFEFKDRKEAEDYAKSSPLQAGVRKIWVDPATGERLGADELNSVDVYRVTVQNQHVEFIDGKGAAQDRAAQLAASGDVDVHEVVPRAKEFEGRQATELSSSLQRLVKKLEKSEAYKNASPTQKTALRQAVNEAALASHGSTRVSSRALPRRGVQGFSEDLVQNTADYAESSSRYLAKLELGHQLETGMKEMAQQIDRDHSKTNQYARTVISNEVRNRVEGDNGYQQGGVLAPIVKRAMSMSFVDKLGSPAYSIINAMQPGMVTMPYLGGKYGFGRAFSALGRAYSDVSAGGVAKQGVYGTGKAIRGQEAKNDLMSLVKRKLSADERRMIDFQIAGGTVDANAGLEVSAIAKSYEGVGGKADAVLVYLENVTREMPRSIETINRTVTALATYRLERASGASHDAATRAAQDAVNQTQFNYSPTNSPAVFNHPLLKMALQFKKYGQGMYQLIGMQIGNAIRNANPGDRKRAVKTLVGIAATHAAMAGALGLPLEPFRYLVMAASPVTGLTWADVENDIRRQAASMFGTTGGEVLTRGLPRLFNMDLSRMGLDSITSFGEPRGNKDSDVKSWLFDSVSGPVVSLGGDYIKGVSALANGDISKAAEKMIPLKAAADSIRAYRQATEGKKTASGKISSEPYSGAEAAMRVLGFGSGREAEETAQRGAYFRGKERQNEERYGLINAWTSAKPSEKYKAWADIQKYNRTVIPELKITAKELTNRTKRDARDSKNLRLGISPKRRDKHLIEEGVYNVR